MSDGAISLYFGLREGQKADLEVVAEAALEWIEVLRAAAHVIEPGAQIRVEFISADESSLRLNTVLEWIEKQLSRLDEGSGKYWRLRKLALALVIFVPTVGIPTYDFYFGDHTEHLSEEDRQLINQLIEKTRHDPDVDSHRRNFFRTIERDHSISGVGVAEGRHDPPAIMVPDTEFAERGGLWAIEEDQQERTLHMILDVVLVRPALVHQPRSWTFQQEGLPEFDAVMRDRRFLAALEHAHVRESLRTGIRMTVRLEVKEKKVEGKWVVKRRGRSVVEVIFPKVD